ncbi:hypothetical protein SAMN05428952_11042 [Nitrosomonas sp. Nm132]|nr:hypothetical protein SAMN05428952_11042 [Nitrosomonas sp. Nm132]
MALVGDGSLYPCQDAAITATALIRQDLADEDGGLLCATP